MLDNSLEKLTDTELKEGREKIEQLLVFNKSIRSEKASKDLIPFNKQLEKLLKKYNEELASRN